MKNFTKFTNPFLWCFLFCVQIVFAQLVPPCPSNTQPPSDYCGECVYANFNGIQSTTNGYTADTIPAVCFDIEHGQFLGFIAGETGATIAAIPTFCQNGNGLEIALLDETCMNVIACAEGVQGGAMVPAALSINNLEIGKTYFLLVDSYAGDNCEFTMAGSPNSAIAAPLPEAPDSIVGPSDVCPGITTQYCINPVLGASGYVWNAPAGALINGQSSPVTLYGSDGLCVDITWPPNATAGPILVNGINSIYTNTPPAVLVVSSFPHPPVIMNCGGVCPEDLPTYLDCCDSVLIGPGSYDCDSITPLGCVIERTVIFTPIVIPPTFLPLQTLCQGDSITICGETLNQSGVFDAVCTSVDGCDSIVKVVLIIADIEAEIQGARTLDCPNDAFFLWRNPDMYNAKWYALDGSFLAASDSLLVSEPGTYVLEASGQTGTATNCIKYDTITIEQNTLLHQTSLSGGLIDCDETFDLEVFTLAQNPQFAWSAGVFPQNTAQVSTTLPGIYSVTVTDGLTGCTSSAEAIVEPSAGIPSVDLSASSYQLNCIHSSVEIAASSNLSDAIFTWSTGETTPQITIQNAGEYSVTVTNPTTACTNVALTVIASNFSVPALSIAGEPLGCSNSASMEVLGPTFMAHYQWSHGASTAATSVNQAGNYSVTVTEQNGCTQTLSYTVVEDKALPQVAAEVQGAFSCTQNEVQILINAAGNYDYFWLGSNGFSALTQHILVNEVGTYLAFIEASNGCDTLLEVVVEKDNSFPNFTASVNGLLTCLNEEVELNVQAQQSYTYFWNGPAGFSAMGASVFSSMPGTYSVTASDIIGCTSEQTIVVPNNALPPTISIPFPGKLNCCNPSKTLVVFTGMQTNLDLEWTFGNMIVHADSLVVTAAGDYTVTATNPTNGCTKSATRTVEADFVSPPLDAQGGTITCTIPTVDLIATSSANVNFNWAGPNGFSSNQAFPNVNVAGIYTVEAISTINCCTSEMSVEVLDSCTISSYFLEKNAEVRIYPNATTGQLFVESLALDFPINAVQVQALDGRILIEKTNLKTNLQELDLGKYPKGMYLLWAEVGGQRLLFKVLLQ